MLTFARTAERDGNTDVSCQNDRLATLLLDRQVDDR